MGTIILSLAVMAFSIYLLAIITEEFFIISLDQISAKLKLPNDVAGASLMAMGSSAPELAIALLALFNEGGAHSDLGIGTIVGSAVFNILIITGVSAIARPAKVTMRVVMRDALMYLASIGLLLFTFRDGVISFVDAILFLVLYAIYIIILFQWNKIVPNEGDVPAEAIEHEAEAHSDEGIYHKITGAIAGIIGIFMGDARKSYVRAFLVSVAFIGIISWFLVEYAVVFSDAVGIPPVIVALTILAGGTSIPDMIASIVVARQGRGQMAVANAVGSNIFDILIGLGFPWLVAMVVKGEEVHVGTGDLWTSTLILLATVFLLVGFLFTGRELNRREGWILVIAYIAYVIWVWFGA